LERLIRQVEVSKCSTESIKQNYLGKIIEDTPSVIPTGYERNYHSTTRDWITNEIFRRVEPKGRTYDEYMKEELVSIIDNGINITLNADEKQLY
jgi:hypothetical protein